MHIFHFNPVLTCKMCANRHLCFLVKTIFGEAAIKDERFVRKRWRFGELATVTHMGVLNARVAILGCVGWWRYFYIKTHFSFYTHHHKWASVVTLFRKLVTSKILSELRVPMSTSLTFSTGCNFSTNAIRFCRTVKNLLNMCIIWTVNSWENILFAFLLEPPTHSPQ